MLNTAQTVYRIPIQTIASYMVYYFNFMLTILLSVDIPIAAHPLVISALM